METPTLFEHDTPVENAISDLSRLKVQTRIREMNDERMSRQSLRETSARRHAAVARLRRRRHEADERALPPLGRPAHARARATADVINGEVISISIDSNGSGYFKAPEIRIHPPDSGTDASVDAVDAIAVAEVNGSVGCPTVN